jgi:hypothetical protein
MAGTRFDAKRLGGRPEMRDGLSYWIPEWPAPDSSGGAAGNSKPNGNSSGNPKRYTFNF